MLVMGGLVYRKAPGDPLYPGEKRDLVGRYRNEEETWGLPEWGRYLRRQYVVLRQRWKRLVR